MILRFDPEHLKHFHQVAETMQEFDAHVTQLTGHSYSEPVDEILKQFELLISLLMGSVTQTTTQTVRLVRPKILTDAPYTALLKNLWVVM